jgi:hypothetical protein
MAVWTTLRILRWPADTAIYIKAQNLSGIDPEDGSLTPLFNPRTDEWHKHFVFQGAIVVGLTNIGRATIQVLAMNDSDRVDLRIHASS